MPSTSKKQHNFMAAVAKNPAFAKKVGVPRSVGEDFLKADKGRKFKEGGQMKNTSRMNKLEEMGRLNAEKAYTPSGKKNLAAEKKRVIGSLNMKKGGEMKKESKAMAKKEISFMKKAGAPKSMIKHEKAEYGMKSGGLAAGHKSADGIAKRGKTRGMEVKMAGATGMKKGGMTRKGCK